MKTYFIFTFRNKKDVILAKDFYYRKGIKTCVINAPINIKDVCSFVLSVGDIEIDRVMYLYNMQASYIVNCYKIVDDYIREKVYKIF